MYIKCFLYVMCYFNHTWRISGKNYENQRKYSIVFSGNTEFREDNREKEREIKISKFCFLYFCFYLIVLQILSRLFVINKSRYTFLWVISIFSGFAHTCPFPLVTLSLFPVIQRRLFLFDQFLYFLFVTYKKPRFLFSWKIKMTRFGESLHKGYSHRYYNCRKVSYGVCTILLRKTFFLLLCVLLFHL